VIVGGTTSATNGGPTARSRVATSGRHDEAAGYRTTSPTAGRVAAPASSMSTTMSTSRASQLGNEPDDAPVALCHGRRSCHIGGAHGYIDSGRYPTRRAATEAFISDSRNHRRKAKGRRRALRRLLGRVL
jgi:hypothetical protein